MQKLLHHIIPAYKPTKTVKVLGKKPVDGRQRCQIFKNGMNSVCPRYLSQFAIDFPARPNDIEHCFHAVMKSRSLPKA